MNKGRTVKTLAICLPAELEEELRKRAAAELLPVSRYVARLLQQAFAQEVADGSKG